MKSPRYEALLRVASLFVCLICSVGQVMGIMDLNGNRVSDLLEMENPGVGYGPGDSDGDGMSDQEEGISGTDPNDKGSFLKLEELLVSDLEVTLKWSGVAGKGYEIQRFNSDADLWEAVLTVLPPAIDGQLESVVGRVDSAIYRVAVSEVDSDGDGLSAWEEARLGWSDVNERSSGDPVQLDYVAALRRIEDPAGVQFAGEDVIPARLPSRDEAVRFLIQTSFGPNESSIAAVRSLGFSRWIDDQFEKPASRMRSYLFANGPSTSSNIMRQTWWRLANIADDQLKQRVAYAWSQIFVVGLSSIQVANDNALVQAEFYDIFFKHGQANYRDLLEGITYSPVMGVYLSHFNNRKSDPGISRYPDENFAREIMQLFSIGLWELNNDGTRKLQDGEFIPTYGNETITEMAKVFTGMSNSRYANGLIATSFFSVPRGNDYRYPMKVWDEEHEIGPKNIINGVVLDGTQTGEEEVQATIDALANHPNVPPFISRLLIQRFVSSNPTPDYLSRVTSTWLGQEPDAEDQQAQVMRAILLDPEARNGNTEDEFRGKVREPILRYLQLFRAFDYAAPSGRYKTDEGALLRSLGQFPTLAPSVFNFYLPDFVPAGEMREEGLVSPEMQISTMSQLLHSDNRIRSVIERGATFLVPDYTDEMALVDDPVALVDHLDSLLTGGSLNESTRATILAAVEAISWPPETRISTAIHLVTQSMEYTVIR